MNQTQSMFLVKSFFSNDSNQSENEIKQLIQHNDEILQIIENNLLLQHDDFIELNKNYIIQFCLNSKYLLELTHSLSKPQELPFMPLVLNLPENLIQIPQEVQNQIQYQYHHNVNFY